jgi:putative restriction endonuclease
MEINILGTNYTVIDAKEKITIADSFVLTANKIGTAHGEGKLYVGNENDETTDFFGQRGFSNNCFLLRKYLIEYLNDCKSEYKKPEQPYQKPENLPELWDKRISKVEEFNEILPFTITDQTQIAGQRVYVNTRDKNYKVIREIALPNISYLSVLKLKNSFDEIFYYFKPFVDYFGDYEHLDFEKEEQEQKIKAENLPKKEKDNLIRARKGQGKYREKLLEQCPFCPITLISDDRLLIASHIKPWVKSNDVEKIDPKNGFMLTPTYDFLFDRGYISFTNDKKIIISPWLSKMTCSKLSISNDKTYSLLPTEGREKYLEYHRTQLLKR